MTFNITEFELLSDNSLSTASNCRHLWFSCACWHCVHYRCL